MRFFPESPSHAENPTGLRNFANSMLSDFARFLIDLNSLQIEVIKQANNYKKVREKY
jgi:hypothetical protein